MKRLWLLAILALSTSVFFTSCGEDPVDPVDPIEENFAPTLTFLATSPNPGSTTNVFSQSEAFQLSENGRTTIYVALEGTDSTPPMTTLEVFRNGTKEDDMLVGFIDQFGVEIAANNPALLAGDYANGFRWEVGLRTTEAFGDNVFRFVLTDEGGLESEVSLTITTSEAGTELDITEENNVIFNMSGMNMGAFDLDNLEQVSSNSTASELQDNGINTDLPASSNWRQTISPENGATMKVVDRTALGENYDYNNVLTKEEILEAWDSGIGVTGSTDQIQVGDEFVVLSDQGTYFLILVTEVNVTTGDNNDNYVFTVKY